MILRRYSAPTLWSWMIIISSPRWRVEPQRATCLARHQRRGRTICRKPAIIIRPMAACPRSTTLISDRGQVPCLRFAQMRIADLIPHPRRFHQDLVWLRSQSPHCDQTRPARTSAALRCPFNRLKLDHWLRLQGHTLDHLQAVRWGDLRILVRSLTEAEARSQLCLRWYSEHLIWRMRLQSHHQRRALQNRRQSVIATAVVSATVEVGSHPEEQAKETTTTAVGEAVLLRLPSQDQRS